MKGLPSTIAKTALLFVAFVGVYATGTTASVATTTANEPSTALLSLDLDTDLILVQASELNPLPGSGTPKPENTRAAFQAV